AGRPPAGQRRQRTPRRPPPSPLRPRHLRRVLVVPRGRHGLAAGRRLPRNHQAHAAVPPLHHLLQVLVLRLVLELGVGVQRLHHGLQGGLRQGIHVHLVDVAALQGAQRAVVEGHAPDHAARGHLEVIQREHYDDGQDHPGDDTPQVHEDALECETKGELDGQGRLQGHGEPLNEGLVLIVFCPPLGLSPIAFFLRLALREQGRVFPPGAGGGDELMSWPHFRKSNKAATLLLQNWSDALRS
ncbi:unnamed protein product, partial [Heterosigma akashiwo]